SNIPFRAKNQLNSTPQCGEVAEWLKALAWKAGQVIFMALIAYRGFENFVRNKSDAAGARSGKYRTYFINPSLTITNSMIPFPIKNR
ncbi:hypothetical protein OS175_15250, partial [Marinicella sp. S1101]|uniref:hypothetical protein n=1 Tax=Marinicella marina TaxID=2996016 RepID=UPI002260971B